jgi:hypothetical protein
MTTSNSMSVKAWRRRAGTGEGVMAVSGEESTLMEATAQLADKAQLRIGPLAGGRGLSGRTRIPASCHGLGGASS